MISRSSKDKKSQIAIQKTSSDQSKECGNSIISTPKEDKQKVQVLRPTQPKPQQELSKISKINNNKHCSKSSSNLSQQKASKAEQSNILKQQTRPQRKQKNQVQIQQQENMNSNVAQTPMHNSQSIPCSPITPSLIGFSNIIAEIPDRDSLIDQYDQLVEEYKTVLQTRKYLLNEKKKINTQISEAYKKQTEIEEVIISNARERFNSEFL